MPSNRTPRPQPVGPSRWRLPDPSAADEVGVVGVGADLSPETLVDAYRRGIFPWPHAGVALPWFSPDPRGVLFLERVRVTRSLRQTLRHSAWETTVDVEFDAVIAACAERDDSWVTPDMRRAYRELHRLGWAHSLEVWAGEELAGGLYGVQVGGVFTGESMFHRAPDASKVALVDLAERLGEAGGAFVDVQLTTEHLAAMGAVDVDRASFILALTGHRDDDVRLARDRRPVSRLAR
ncbi:MAG: leucyl/phenylalanyl-tRNA--protein transferase [Actinobacteria bacterium]|nr:MAG: leucyl/phenylalanyl-tRNA--protein transferase [Actinomycetota bacterium]